ncbi:PREDICTED: protocadherin-like wing polarity protein stan isoform X1 [Nicrophorus vespilloides]|uniref:Protocadherin-like wing polarity protein stan isoform X1 n=1 Tax=Nicrophorus vespilloides TaxID=110193 RepID=A0ABM1NJM5_NICVS|nr:PREDICTED: protocadherin-like wing polarity protein stan isoform X1 [Nicrophorus vespilloides]
MSSSKAPAIERSPLLLALLLCLPLLSNGYLLLVTEDQASGDVIFDASVYRLGSERSYKVNHERSASFVDDLIEVDPHDGIVRLLQPLHCNSLYYPNLFTVHIDSTSNRLRDIDYYSLPLRIFIVGAGCSEDRKEVTDNDDDLSVAVGRRKRNAMNPFLHRAHPNVNTRVSAAKRWISETYASFAIPTSDKWQRICLKKSQFINSITAFLPRSIAKNCTVTFVDLNDDRFKIEASQGDLVASEDVCILEPLWKVVVLFNAQCSGNRILDSDHRLKIVYHHQIFNDTDIAKRVRRELRNQSPFFEQHLYIASVMEECDPGVAVITMKARDPENNLMTYSMVSLLDSRTQSMFDIDTKSGLVTTSVKLDRELVDVHYFKVLATDDSFPPRSGTTMLQINVLDANDHTPVFEMNDYEASVREGVSVGTTVITLKATDQDYGKNSEVEYSIQSVFGGGTSKPEDDNKVFKIDSKSGVITTRSSLDRETTEVYTLIVDATDQATPQSARRSASATVVINVSDDNDNYPQFSERAYTVNIREDINWSENPVVAHIKASDADQGVNAAIRYAIIGGNTQSQFTIDSLSGDVTLVKPLDYEILRNYRLVVRAQDGGNPSRSNTTQLLIKVEDVNDNAPRFYTSLFQESVSESVSTGFSILKVQAFDNDDGLNANILYNIAPRDASGASTEDIPLTVDAHSGWIYTTKQLDREEQSKYMLQVIARDQGNPPLSATASIVITVQDVNDNDPVFEPKVYEALVSEDDPPGTQVTTVTASDADEDTRLHYELSNGNSRNRFSITSQNGRGLITIAQPLDYKQEKRYVLEVTASDSGGRKDKATVYVNVTDANNFSPVFENAPYSASVFEDAIVGTTVLVVSASDNDVGLNAEITYSLGEDTNLDRPQDFTINPQTGAIVTAKTLDREVLSGYILTVTAKDGGNPPLSDTTDVEITVTDVNDNFPIFQNTPYSGSVSEDALIGTSILQIAATDADIGLNGRIRYTLSEKDIEDGSFVIDPTSGVIRTNKGLDRESVASYTLEAHAIDRGSPPRSSTVPVVITILDVNDSPPTFDTDKIVLYIPENSPIRSTVGEIQAKDPDEGQNAKIEYTIIGGEDSNCFSLVAIPGTDKAELITMTELDYESPKKKYDLIVRASSRPLRSDVPLEVIVTDVNDNAPVLKDFHILFNNFKDHFPSAPIGRIPAFDADVSDRLHYRILSGNNANLVALNETSGQLQLSPQLNTNVPKVATMEVSVTDGVNDVKAIMQLSVKLITESMLYNSITVRLNQMTKEAFLSPLLTYFIDGLAAILPCPKENIFIFSIQDDIDVNSKILNVSFSVKRPDVPKEEYYTQQFLKERVYLKRSILAAISTVQVLPFDDNLCVSEPCLNYEECLTVLKFGNASGFISSSTVLFRPIYPVTAFTCRCPLGFTGSKEHYLCDTEVNLCYSAPCQNNGTCRVKEGGYTCVCPPDFTGPNCEIKLNSDTCNSNICKSGSTCTKRLKGGFVCEDCSPATGSEHYTPLCELKSRSFSANSFLTFPSLKQRHRMHLQLRFATTSRNGLLLYNGRYNELHDFIALEIVNASVQFSFSLGSGVTRATASLPGGVSDGEWHTVTVHYFNKSVTISLDDCDTALALAHGEELGGRWECAGYSQHILESRCSSLTETCHRFLDLTGPLQLGGLPTLPEKFQAMNHHYVGCISDLEVDYQFVDLNSFVADNGTVAGCPEKRSYCSSKPCKNGGVCKEVWSMFRCECAEGFGGKDCGESVNKPWRFEGDGTLSFIPTSLRPIQLPWINSMTVRTLQQDAFLMSGHLGQNSSAVLHIRNGLVAYSYNGESLNFSVPKFVSDGRWHRIDVLWLGTEIKISVDYGERTAVVPFNSKIQGLIVGKILVGGPDDTFTFLNAGYNYFDGCIQDVRIGNNQQMLNTPTARKNVLDGCESNVKCTTECPANANCVVEWGSSRCECHEGHVGPLCVPICSKSPCENSGLCVEELSTKGYKCDCNSTIYSGEYCENRQAQPCPSSWWGFPFCGPCHCDVESGYHPDCNKKTGQCRCRENHYQPPGTTQCLPCDCYLTGSYSAICDQQSGQCRCKDGVIGKKCDSCPNPYAEITLQGCEVVYDGCPRSASDGIWWPRTSFGAEATETCPKGTLGKASRSCDNQLGGWQSPDLFNCTSEKFVELRVKLSAIEKETDRINTFDAINLASDLHKATNHTSNLYGADVLITNDLIMELLKHESQVHGLNLTHSQDKDYISNLVLSASSILDSKYSEHWKRIKELTESSGEKLIASFEKYINVLCESKSDIYTNPFEIVASNVVLGLDIITPDSLYGQEKNSISIISPDNSFTTERVVIPDTSQFLENSESTQSLGPLVSFPKYNNYLKDKSKFDVNSKILVPLKLLGIKPLEIGELSTKNSKPLSGPVISYVQYKQAGNLLPDLYDDSVVRRWGVDIAIGSPLISLSILIPEYVEAVNKTITERKITFEDIKEPEYSFRDFEKKSFSEGAIRGHENEAQYYRLERAKRDESETRKVLFRSLSGVMLHLPVRLQIWLDDEKMIFNERSNPQCVHWSTARGFGEWSRVGCRTEVNDDWFDRYDGGPLLVNCTCNHLSTFAVLVDVVDLEYIPEPSLLEDISSYSCFSLSLPILFATYLILAFLRGAQTNSNTIRKNLVLCVFLAELLYFVALKARKPMVGNEFGCKLVAMGLHYLWLGAFAWMLVDALHLYRMLTEMRDINHGPMRFYYCIGYVLPAIIVSMAVGVRAHQYGNYYFCWVSLYESVIWSVVGPIGIFVFFNVGVLMFAVRAAFTLQDHVMGFGNLRTLLWVSVVALPLLGASWVLALLAASEKHPLLTPILSLAVLVHALFSLLGYCVANNRVRQNLVRTILRCMGRKVPLLETNSVAGVASTSSQNLNAQSRSALAYHSSAMDAARRNIGISTSSTTSRSTTKTSSSPYRSDTHLRHTSTSTSNYNSTSDVPSYLRGFEQDGGMHRHREVVEDSGRRDRRDGRDSDSDSDGSEGRSLELASSHSSDDDESSARRHRGRMGGRQGYLPNITEHVVTRCGTPPALNVVTKSQLFPSVQPYAPRWSSQLPEAYLHSPPVPEVGRWSAETGSDNEFCHKSPNPLPNPDITPDTCLPSNQSEQYMMRAHYDPQYVTNMAHTKAEYMGKLVSPHENINYQEYAERCSDLDEKHHINDKYLFPYTAEEDHMASHNNYMHHPSSRIMSPITNDVNNPGMDYHGSRMGSRMGSVLGSVHGSICGSTRGSPSPLMPPVTMMHSNHHPVDPTQWCWEYGINK